MPLHLNLVVQWASVAHLQDSVDVRTLSFLRSWFELTFLPSSTTIPSRRTRISRNASRRTSVSSKRWHASTWYGWNASSRFRRYVNYRRCLAALPSSFFTDNFLSSRTSSVPTHERCYASIPSSWRSSSQLQWSLSSRSTRSSK